MVILGSALVPTAHAQGPILPLVAITFAPSPIVQSVEEEVLDAQYAYGLDDTFYRTLQCESLNFTHSGQSLIPHEGGPNGREDSWGVAQIHLPAHLDITKAQALDPLFAINWAAQQFADGRAYMWTCYRQLTADSAD